MAASDADRARIISATLRAVRRRRHMKAAEVAEQMDLPLRTYQHFEAGETGLDFDRLERFARATQSDLFGLTAAILLERPMLAVNVLDNKAMLAIHVAMRDFQDRLGDRLVGLEFGPFLARLSGMLQQVETEVTTRFEAERKRITECSISVGLGAVVDAATPPRSDREPLPAIDASDRTRRDPKNGS